MRKVRVGPPKAKTVSKIRRTKKEAYTENWNSVCLRIKKRDGYACTKCGSTERLQVDHIVPVSCGGLTVDSNLRTLCCYCHANLPRHNKNKNFILASSRRRNK